MVSVDLDLCRVTDFSLVVRYTGSLGGGILNRVLFVAVGELDRCGKTREVCTDVC